MISKNQQDIRTNAVNLQTPTEREAEDIANLEQRNVERRITSIKIFPVSVNMEIGESVCVYESIFPTDVPNRRVEWSSSDESVASVNSFSGLVSAHKAGVAFIYANAQDGGGASDYCVVTVNKFVAVEVIKLNCSMLKMCVGDKRQLFAKVYPVSATNGKIVWSSSNSSIVQVDPYTGVVVAKRAGIATISVNAQDGSGVTESCTVYVKRLKRNLREYDPKRQLRFFNRI